jgi:type IV pilus assembly protein PilV
MCNRAANKGFSLIEILIALIVLSIGLLGHTKTLSVGLRATTDANLRTQATYLVNEMVERMRSNRPAAHSGYYAEIDYAGINCSINPAKICSEGVAGTAVECTTNELADEDSYHWLCQVQSTLPGGEVSVSTSAGVYSIQTRWDGLDEHGNVQVRNVSASFIP